MQSNTARPHYDIYLPAVTVCEDSSFFAVTDASPATEDGTLSADGASAARSEGSLGSTLCGC